MTDPKPESKTSFHMMLLGIAALVFLALVVLLHAKCPPIPVPASEPAPVHAPHPEIKPASKIEVPPSKIEIDSNKPDLGIPSPPIS